MSAMPRCGARLRVALLPLSASCLVVATGATVRGVDERINFVCEVSGSPPRWYLEEVTKMNCDKVQRVSLDQDLIAAQGSRMHQRTSAWSWQTQNATALCTEATRQSLLGTDVAMKESARLAVNAWGSVMTRGRECCVMLSPPYCYEVQVWASTYLLAVPVCVLALLLIGTLLSRQLWFRPRLGGDEQELNFIDTKTTRISQAGVHVEQLVETKQEPAGFLQRFMDYVAGKEAEADELCVELQNKWAASCLRKLPQAPEYGRMTASLFSALQRTFDFQVDSMRNQHEHLISLWRSQCAMVADRQIEHLHENWQEDDQIDESHLLSESLGDLHVDLLEGYLAWREKLREYVPSGLPERSRKGCPLAGMKWDAPAPLQQGMDDSEALTLTEMATFLLVWGEAGNIRFMPELVYFLTDLVLYAERPPRGADRSDRAVVPEELYGGRAQVEADPTRSAPGVAESAPFRSNQFLTHVIRPIYNVVFDEWHDFVDVDEKSQKDKKKLKSAYESFLPPDVANYDDWNELFGDPERLVRGLVLKNNRGKFFDLPHGRRFVELQNVDWAMSLKAELVKTHREVHSLWGVFGTTHRVWLLHGVLFILGVVSAIEDPEEKLNGEQPIGGRTRGVRFAVVGLLVPWHAFLWSMACSHTKGWAVTPTRDLKFMVRRCVRAVMWSTPMLTYILARVLEAHGSAWLPALLVFHFLISFLGIGNFLFRPKVGSQYKLFTATSVPLKQRSMRYAFWFLVLGNKFLMGTFLFQAMHETMVKMDLTLPGQQSFSELMLVMSSATWAADIFLWSLLWVTTFFLFLSDTQLWFTVACAFLGVGTMLMQRGCRCISFLTEDAVAKIPERFSKQVLFYRKDIQNSRTFCSGFPALWDRMLEYMRYEDKLDNQLMSDLSFAPNFDQVSWHRLGAPLGAATEASSIPAGFSIASLEDAAGEACRPSSPGPCRPHSPGARPGSPSRVRVRVPDIFREKTLVEASVRQSCANDPHWPRNSDLQWRFIALARGLGLPMPRPFRVPYIPGITVLIPHYGEGILMTKKELFQGGAEVPLMHWLMHNYNSEFTAFTSRMQGRGEDWPVVGSDWSQYTERQWERVSAWASMRMQTLWRTVAGMCYYYPALQYHYEVQGDYSGSLGSPDVWNPSDCFTCMVSMQMYAFFNKEQLDHTNTMFNKFPSCFKVAFIDCQGKGKAADADGVHERQRRRYFSCLIDRSCQMLEGGRRKPSLRIELPGFPILGDGKGDNQNHAIPFMRGVFAQCIDANQGAYMEQMLLLPCALGEFRSRSRGDAGCKRIVGFAEHITSDIGSIGDFAASAEVAFGTILQRTYSVLGARMHYGHPDIMNKLFMMQQGGVSKATKTLNLSEDIFAGMDFTLRGQGRSIKHCEYFNLAKGRDLGFNTVLGFFSKLSSGTGEQVITRQAFRLGQVLHLPEALTFYYAHVGYYFTQFLVSMSMPLLVFVWLLVIFSDCESTFEAFFVCGEQTGNGSSSHIMANLLGVWFSWLLLFFLVATSLPLFVEVWMERSLLVACVRFVKQMLTLSPMMFIFQGKIIGHYVVNEIRYGGATYVSTGRGLPTDRRPFIGEAQDGGLKLSKVGGLYLDYAAITYYDGVKLGCGVALVVVAGGVSQAGSSGAMLTWVFISLGLVISSWLLAPFIFNPYQFQLSAFLQDLRCTAAFFLEDSGRHWVEWYDRTQLRKGSGRSAVDISFFIAAFLIVAWYAMMNVKIAVFDQIYYADPMDRPAQSSLGGPVQGLSLNVLVLVPPFVFSLCYCIVVSSIEVWGGVYNIMRRARLRLRRRSDAEAGAEVEEDPEEQPVAHVRETDRTVSPVSDESDQKCCCALGLPLAISSMLIIALDFAEAVVALHRLALAGWWNAFLAAFVLKWGVVALLLVLGEGVLRKKWSPRMSSLVAPLDLWVRAHRIARDMFAASLILALLLPLVLINKLNDCVCPGLSLHHLLMYRNPNHMMKQEVDLEV